MRVGSSFAARLTIMATVITAVAVTLVCGATVILQIQRVHNTAVEMVDAQARVIAANSIAMIDFDDEEAALTMLRGLVAVQEFVAAEIRRPNHEVFVRYERPEVGTLPDLAGLESPRLSGRWLAVPEPIFREGEHIGTLKLLYDLAHARRQLYQDIAIALAVAVLATVFAYFAAQRVQRSLLRPVRELSSAAQAIARSEDYSIRAKKVSDDELGALTEVFNSMIQRIDEAEAIRRNHRETLERVVAERTAETIEAQGRLRAQERMASLGTLSAGLGHDIGNLLIPLRSHISAIRDKLGDVGSLDPEAEQDFFAITKATEYLQSLSSGLRLLAQNPERVASARETTHISAWWTEIEPLLRATVGRGIMLEHRFPQNLPRVRLSRALLMQSVFNLVQNAAQAFTPEGGPVPPHARIQVHAVAGSNANGPTVELAVTDNGPGMSDEVRRRCMEPYFTTKTRRISSGLGLSLVKGIVEGVGGQLRVDSAIGEGSTFTLILPAEPAAAAPTPTTAFLTVQDPRRRAVLTTLLSALNCRVNTNASASEPEPAEPARNSVWLTDSLAHVPHEWPGRVILLGDPPAFDRKQSSITVLEPTTPLSVLRRTLQELLPGA